MKSSVFMTTVFAGSLSAVQAYPFVNGGAVHSGLMEQWLCAADMDRNGRTDVVCGETDGHVYILKGNGQGGFAESTLASLAGYRSANGAAADLNRDGRMDFVAYLYQPSQANNPARCAVLLQQANGTFGSPLFLLSGGGAATHGPLAIADMDRDGRPDVVMGWKDTTASVNQGRVSWFRNLGNNTFDDPVSFFLGTFANLAAIAAGDFNKDGYTDMAAADSEKDEVKIFSGPTFFGASAISGLTDVHRLIATDADVNGRIDLFSLSGPVAGGFRKLHRLSNTDSGWTKQELASETTGPFAALASADLDADRRPDPVFIGESATQCSIEMTRPVYGSYTDGSGPSVNLSMGAITLADCDGDGDQDLFATVSTGVLLQKNIAPHAVWRQNYSWPQSSGASGAAALASADFNGDGLADIAAASAGDGKLRWYKTGSNGQPEVPVTIASIAAVSCVTVGDIDRDGDTDIICPSIPAGKVLWFANNNNGASWTQNTITHSFGLPTWVRATDYDGDGDMDVIVSSDLPGPGIHLLRNENNGLSWAISALRQGASGPFEVADIIPGGAPEVVCKGSDNAVGLTYYDSATQMYKTKDLGGAGDLTKGLALGDTDGDGDIDIVSGRSNRVLHIRQTGLNQWAQPVELVNFGGSPSSAVRSLQIADCNGDGSNEILCAHRNAVQRLFLNADGTATLEPVYIASGSGNTDYGDILAGHFNWDGVTDVACAAVLSGLQGELRIASGEAYQADLFANPVIAQASGHRGRIIAGRKAAVMKLRYVSYGEPGDASTRPHHVNIEFTRANNTELTSAEFTALIEKVEIVRDTVNPGIYDPTFGSYDPTKDSVVQSFTSFPDSGDIMFTVQTQAILPGEEAIFYVVVTPRDDAAANAPVKDINVSLPMYLTYDPATDSNAVTTNTAPEGVRLRLGRRGQTANLSLGSATPIQQWRFSHWGDPFDQGPGANNADPDRDGIPNLIEYACNAFPTTREADGGAAFMMRRPIRVFDASFLEFAVGTRPDVKIAVQYTAWPGSAWTTLTQREGTGSWLGPGAITTGATVGSRTWFSARHDTAAPRQYYRLSVTELPAN